jgi:hypothetical protein
MSGHPRLGDFFSNRQESGQPGLPVMSVTMNIASCSATISTGGLSPPYGLTSTCW